MNIYILVHLVFYTVLATWCRQWHHVANCIGRRRKRATRCQMTVKTKEYSAIAFLPLRTGHSSLLFICLIDWSIDWVNLINVPLQYTWYMRVIRGQTDIYYRHYRRYNIDMITHGTSLINSRRYWLDYLVTCYIHLSKTNPWREIEDIHEISLKMFTISPITIYE